MDEKLLESLKRMEELLRKYRCYGQADVVLKLIAFSAKDESTFWGHLKGIGMWGGSGSVCDVNLVAIAQEDMSVLRRLLLSVATIMEQHHQTTPRVQQISQDLKDTLGHLK